MTLVSLMMRADGALPRMSDKISSAQAMAASLSLGDVS